MTKPSLGRFLCVFGKHHWKYNELDGHPVKECTNCFKSEWGSYD